MPTATISTPSGAKIVIDGTDQEIVSLIAKIENLQSDNKAGGRTAGPRRQSRPSVARQTLSGLLSEMIDDGFFKQPRMLSAVKEHLEQNGQFFPLTTLSPAMLRLVRSRQLRRIKDDSGRWAYVR